jgi:hypothetical protein
MHVCMYVFKELCVCLYMYCTCEGSGFHGDENEGDCFLSCSAVQSRGNARKLSSLYMYIFTYICSQCMILETMYRPTM